MTIYLTLFYHFLTKKTEKNPFFTFFLPNEEFRIFFTLYENFDQILTKNQGWTTAVTKIPRYFGSTELLI